MSKLLLRWYTQDALDQLLLRAGQVDLGIDGQCRLVQLDHVREHRHPLLVLELAKGRVLFAQTRVTQAADFLRERMTDKKRLRDAHSECGRQARRRDRTSTNSSSIFVAIAMCSLHEHSRRAIVFFNDYILKIPSPVSDQTCSNSFSLSTRICLRLRCRYHQSD